MLVLREASPLQAAKVAATISYSEVNSNCSSCPGECWDCDSCGGSVTH